ncbi:MAG: antibiotic biosynthesis monooxygenase [Betaproteobacteria bacterium]|nr:antibiotic biosynthesis monooxygenase [Betaproteobacteria bacterium]
MHVTLVHVRVKAETIAAFVEACRLNHEASIREPGNRRFDVLQDPADPCRFLLYEAYASPTDAAAHKQTAHYLAWRDSVAEMMAEPRKGVSYAGLYPG